MIEKFMAFVKELIHRPYGRHTTVLSRYPPRGGKEP
jgi:hypothetical protein